MSPIVSLCLESTVRKNNVGRKVADERLQETRPLLHPVDPEASEYQVVPSDRGDGLCGAIFLMIDRDVMDSVINLPAKGEPYVIAVEAINDLCEENGFEAR